MQIVSTKEMKQKFMASFSQALDAIIENVRAEFLAGIMSRIGTGKRGPGRPPGGGVAHVAGKRGPGRPPGSKNKVKVVAKVAKPVKKAVAKKAPAKKFLTQASNNKPGSRKAKLHGQYMGLLNVVKNNLVGKAKARDLYVNESPQAAINYLKSVVPKASA